MYASRHAGICTGVKVLLLLHILQSPNYKAHIFIWPNKTNEISSHLLRSTKCFCLLFTSDSVKISVFNSNFQLCTPKYPSPPLTFSWCLCAPAPTIRVNKTPRFCHGGQGEGDAQPSHWLKVSCACHLRPKPRLKSAAIRPGPQRVMSISTPEPPPSTFFPLSILCLLTCSAVCTKCFNMHF